MRDFGEDFDTNEVLGFHSVDAGIVMFTFLLRTLFKVMSIRQEF